MSDDPKEDLARSLQLVRDMRSPLAKARDRWFESAQGQALQDGAAAGQYLRNRLEAAFIAGYDAAIELLKERP